MNALKKVTIRNLHLPINPSLQANIPSGEQSEIGLQLKLFIINIILLFLLTFTNFYFSSIISSNWTWKFRQKEWSRNRWPILDVLLFLLTFIFIIFTLLASSQVTEHENLDENLDERNDHETGLYY